MIVLKTRVRLLTIIFSILMLGFFGIIPYMLFVVGRETKINIATVAGAIFFALFLAGIFAICRLSLIISIDELRKEITFYYPFRFLTRTYNFSQIVGFRFHYLHAKIDYKSLRFKTSDNRVYSFSDFEISNLREVESIALHHFNLTAGREFKSLTEKEKEMEIRISQTFDLTQAKDIKMFLVMGVIMLGVSGCYILFRSFKEAETISKGALIAVGIFAFLIFLMTRKLSEVSLRLKQLKSNIKE